MDLAWILVALLAVLANGVESVVLANGSARRSNVSAEREESFAEEELRKQLALLSHKYDMMCREMRLVSQHVVFLEQALSDLSHFGDVLYRKKRDTASESEPVVPNQVLETTELPAAQTQPIHEPTTTPTANVTEDDSIIVVRPLDQPDVLEVNPASEPPMGSNPGQPDHKCQCNLLHEFSCPIDASKSFDHQFNDWYHNLLFSMSHNCSEGAKEFARRKRRPKHHHKHHRNYRNTGHGNSTLAAPSSMNAVQIDLMEESLVDEETVYATCDVIPNRHISLILQQNVKGRINLWQRSSGQGALHAHVQLTGFKVLVGERRRRETDLIPVKTASPATPSASASPPVTSMEHGFHVHASGDLSRSCQSTGTHFNPTNSSHGGPLDSNRHVGDLGNIRADERGNIDAEYSYPYASLIGPHSIIGKSLVVSMDALRPAPLTPDDVDPCSSRRLQSTGHRQLGRQDCLLPHRAS